MAAAIIPLVMQGGASLMAASSERQAGRADRKAAEFEANQEGINAIERENERKERLMDALASQNVAAAAAGISVEGSPLNIMQSDIAKAERETQRDLTQTRGRQASLRHGAIQRQRLGRQRSDASLLRTGANIAQTGGFGRSQRQPNAEVK